MATWTLVPCLATLRSEFNVLAPFRLKTSDGSIGDPAHADSSSDHNPDETGNTPSEDADSINEVHAIDVDKDLRRTDWTMAKAVQIIVLRHRDGRDDRLQNVIHNRVIWSRSWGWTARTYTGSNAHIEHAHFGARYTTSEENDTRPWGLLAAAEAEEDDMATITQADFDERMDSWWTRRMAADSSPHAALLQLRKAPWNQVVNPATGETMYQVIHKAAAAYPAITALALAFQAFAETETVNDAATATMLQELKVKLQQVDDQVEATPAEPVNS